VIRRKYFVAGRVQGVYYRATAARYARELGITGHARNLPDGRVEVLAFGNEAAHDELIRWLWIGSSASKVTAVETADVAGELEAPTAFITR
jgi:acylphosphatase